MNTQVNKTVHTSVNSFYLNYDFLYVTISIPTTIFCVVIAYAHRPIELSRVHVHIFLSCHKMCVCVLAQDTSGCYMLFYLNL